jgi:hypothetical protein
LDIVGHWHLLQRSAAIDYVGRRLGFPYQEGNGARGKRFQIFDGLSAEAGGRSVGRRHPPDYVADEKRTLPIDGKPHGPSPRLVFTSDEAGQDVLWWSGKGPGDIAALSHTTSGEQGFWGF